MKSKIIHGLLIIVSTVAIISCKKEIKEIDNGDQNERKVTANATNEKHTGTAVVTVLATGFDNPRGLKFGPDGNLYVTETGTGGYTSTEGLCVQTIEPFGPELGSPVGGRISKVTMSGVRTTVTTDLPTIFSFGDILGVADVAFMNGDLYVLTNGGCSHGVIGKPSGIYKVNSNGTTTLVADLSAWQAAHPVAHPEAGDFEPDGSWYALIARGNELYALDANHSELIKSDLAGNVTRVVDFSATEGHNVPTAMDQGGEIYVANLGVFPITPTSKIYRVNAIGKLAVVETDLSAPIGLVVKKGRMYVLEMSVGTDFPEPGAGRIIRIDPNGNRQVVASGLSLPTGMTMGPDGNLYVSEWGFGFGREGGHGQILKVKLTD